MARWISWLRVGLALTWTALLGVPLIVAFVCLLPWRRGRIVAGALYGRALGWVAMRTFGVRVVLRGGEHLHAHGPVMMVANHASNLDPFLAFQINPIGGVGVAKREIVFVPFFGVLWALSGHLMVNRSSHKDAVAALDDVAALVRRERLGIWIYPEGTQPRDGKLLPFKKGFVHLAVATGLPVVPMVVHDAAKLWPARTLDVRPGVVHIDILPPIQTAGWSAATADLHAEAVHRVFVDALAAGPG